MSRYNENLPKIIYLVRQVDELGKALKPATRPRSISSKQAFGRGGASPLERHAPGVTYHTSGASRNVPDEGVDNDQSGCSDA